MIKKGNKIKVLSGKDKNKEGEIIEIDRKKNRAKVKGLNMIKKHVKSCSIKCFMTIGKNNKSFFF